MNGHNLRPFLNTIATEILAVKQANNIPMDEAFCKVVEKKSHLNDEMIKQLIGITNKTRILTTGERDFDDVVTQEKVASRLYPKFNENSVKTASASTDIYYFPEYQEVYEPRLKCASDEDNTLDREFNVKELFVNQLREDKKELFTKLASNYTNAEKGINSMIASAKELKRFGIDNTHISKQASYSKDETELLNMVFEKIPPYSIPLPIEFNEKHVTHHLDNIDSLLGKTASYLNEYSKLEPQTNELTSKEELLMFTEKVVF